MLFPREGRVKGYEVGKDEYVIVSEDELTAIDLESNHSINIESFIERSEVETVYLYQGYYIAPEGKVGQEAFAVPAPVWPALLCTTVNGLFFSSRHKGIIGTTLLADYEMHSDTPC